MATELVFILARSLAARRTERATRARRLAYASRLPELQKNVERINSNNLQSTRNQYENEIKRILLTDDLLAMATNTEKKHLQKLEQVKTRIDKLSTQRSMDTAEDKHRLLLGVIKWDIASQFGPRSWSLKKELKQLDEAQATVAEHEAALLLDEAAHATSRFECR